MLVSVGLTIIVKGRLRVLDIKLTALLLRFQKFELCQLSRPLGRLFSQNAYGILLSETLTPRLDQIIGKSYCQRSWVDSFGRMVASGLVFNVILLARCATKTRGYRIQNVPKTPSRTAKPLYSQWASYPPPGGQNLVLKSSRQESRSTHGYKTLSFPPSSAHGMTQPPIIIRF